MKLQLPNFSQARVMVVGDVMLDRYWHGDTERISPEAPVPVVHVNKIEDRPGGAGNVALNIKALGGDVSLFGCVGLDEAATILLDKFQNAQIRANLARINKPTITKLRVLSLHQQLIRLDFEETLYHEHSKSLYENIHLDLTQHNVLILSDYGKGTLSKCQALIQRAREQGLQVLVDPKGTDFEKYRGASLLTPNRKEFEAVVGRCQNENELIDKGLLLLRKFDFNALLVTLGAQGMMLLQKDEQVLHLAAKAQEVFDVTGAGDTVIATLGAALSAGSDLVSATQIANRAAGLAVAKLGAASIGIHELRRVISGKGIMTEEELIIAVADAKLSGERIVMTNGCFDILHAGHIAYLEEAKALGDRLIVAINDNDSVSKLKGPGRPINTLKNRMQVLAGLFSVDWVVPFSEDTPERLINRVLPHVLVKGGDYHPDQIAGGQAVRKNGGEVKILNFVEGCSTSAIVKRILEEV
jgi:D-beta-D-heptose 7-phosphate kinase/D-beta-D-heptose 1-phosphate adenosyltransferase